MERKEVYKVIDGERNYQNKGKGDPNSHIVEDFPLSSALVAMRKNLRDAEEAWYNGKAPYEDAMEFIRKVTAIGVQMGEKYGMPERKG